MSITCWVKHNINNKLNTIQENINSSLDNRFILSSRPSILGPRKASVAHPGECRGTRLARAQCSGTALRDHIAGRRVIAVIVVGLVVTLEWLKVMYLVQCGRVAHPLKHLPVSYDIDVILLNDLIQELDERLPVVLSVEPGRVIEKSKRSSVRLVVAVEVLKQHVVHSRLV